MKLSILPVLFFIVFSGCKEGDSLSDFSSDGCSLFPDQSVISGDDWCECCFEHDVAYWMGGTEEERELADLRLRGCVLKKTGNEALADMMYQGVRFGGSPYFYNWYRWGYGWNYDRKYQALTEEERVIAQIKLEAYFEKNPDGYCGAKDAKQLSGIH